MQLYDDREQTSCPEQLCLKDDIPGSRGGLSKFSEFIPSIGRSPKLEIVNLIAMPDSQPSALNQAGG